MRSSFMWNVTLSVARRLWSMIAPRPSRRCSSIRTCATCTIFPSCWTTCSWPPGPGCRKSGSPENKPGKTGNNVVTAAPADTGFEQKEGLRQVSSRARRERADHCARPRYGYEYWTLIRPLVQQKRQHCDEQRKHDSSDAACPHPSASTIVDHERQDTYDDPHKRQNSQGDSQDRQ